MLRHVFYVLNILETTGRSHKKSYSLVHDKNLFYTHNMCPVKYLTELHVLINLEYHSIKNGCHFKCWQRQKIGTPVGERCTFSPMRLRWSCSGSAAHLKKVHTSLATWLMVAGVPIRNQENRNHQQHFFHLFLPTPPLQTVMLHLSM